MQQEEQKMRLAEDLQADVEVIYTSIDQNYQHQRFAPGQLAKLQRGLELAGNK
ncbi:MAG: hypothetical protein QNJ47_23330 [Nostocaceae cyanobacterium]|nr:hypothetical protein [Nostocaceae cyanobacterium]